MYVSHCTNQRLAILAAEDRERELRLLDEVQFRGSTSAGRASEASGEQQQQQQQLQQEQHGLEGLVETLESDIDMDIDMDTTTVAAAATAAAAAAAAATAGQEEGKLSSRLVGGESDSKIDERTERVVDFGRREGMDRQPESQTLLPTTSESFGDPTNGGGDRDRDRRGTDRYTHPADNANDHHQPGSGNDYYPRRGGGSGEGIEPAGPLPGAGQQERGRRQGQQEEQKLQGQEMPADGDGVGTDTDDEGSEQKKSDEGSEQKESGKRVRAAIGVVAAAAYYGVWVAVALVLG